MIQYTSGDLFASTAESIVNPTNARGVMGAGLAKEFARRYPELKQKYRKWCEDYNEETASWPIGMAYPYFVGGPGKTLQMIYCIPTKDDWRDPSKLEYVEKGLESLRSLAEFHEITSIAMPALGCGLGKLSFKDVQQKIEQTFADSLLRITVYLPQGVR
jgi:O-acetyl-ADP-ribose deacetylase (regulator of RNase III)